MPREGTRSAGVTKKAARAGKPKGSNKESSATNGTNARKIFPSSSVTKPIGAVSSSPKKITRKSSSSNSSSSSSSKNNNNSDQPPPSSTNDHNNSNTKNPFLYHKNRMLLLQLEQMGILAPGVLTVSISPQTGDLELTADLSFSSPDTGTMAGLFPTPSTTHHHHHDRHHDHESPVPTYNEQEDKSNPKPEPEPKPKPEQEQEPEAQIPSWLREYLLKELNVSKNGPPRLGPCLALHDHLKASQHNVGMNMSLATASILVPCAQASLEHAVQEIQDFVDSKAEWMVADTYGMEVGVVIGTVKRLLGGGGGGGGESDQGHVRILLDIASNGGVGMKSALEEALRTMVVEPFGRLVERLRVVGEGLRREVDIQKDASERKYVQSEDGLGGSQDSGVDV